MGIKWLKTKFIRKRINLEHRDIVNRFLKEPGVEIGAFKTPIPGIKPIYVDRFREYAHEKTLADYYGDTCDLPFYDSSLAYVAASHVIEHVANPIGALKEWYRVLKHHGIIYMVVPDRRRTFDHNRPLTSIEHILEDYHRGVSQVDGTHIHDFVYGVDWSQFSPETPIDIVITEQKKLEESCRAAITAGSEINIHFHTFEPESMLSLLALVNRASLLGGQIEILEIHQNFPSTNPNGFLVVGRVEKNIYESCAVLAKSRSGALKPDAMRF